MNRKKPGDFTPRLTLDLNQATQSQLDDLMADFKELIKNRGNTRPKLPFSEGWNTVIPETAEEGLLRNVGNRRVTLDSLKYYWRQMDDGLWMPTGEPLIFDEDGNLVDGQTRLLACYLGGGSFETFVVTTTKRIPNIFAYVDNGKSRSPAAALETAGFNGLSGLMVKTIKLIRLFDNHAWKKLKADNRRAPKISPAEILTWVADNLDIKTVVHSAVANYKDAISLIIHKEVVTTMAWLIEKKFDEVVAEDFFTELGDTSQKLPDGSPIKALQHKLQLNNRSRDPMTGNEVLAYVIRTFNYWKLGEKVVGKLNVNVEETMPILIDSPDAGAEQHDEAA